MTYLIPFLDNHGKTESYTGGGICGLYNFLDIIVAANTSTYLGQISQSFSNSYFNNNDIYFIQIFIRDLNVRQKIICGFHGRIGHKSDPCIICGPKCIPPSLNQKMSKLNSL